MVDIDAAIGYVVAWGDWVDRARLSWLRAGITPSEEVLTHVETGQTSSGGWPAQWGKDTASVDATCFRFTELDDLDGLGRPAATRALDWLAGRQRSDGFWEEDAALADLAPPWAAPGDPDARFYLTVNAAFWLAVASRDAGSSPAGEIRYEAELALAARTIRESLGTDGSWPGFLISGWLSAAVLYHTGWFYESARISLALTDRVAAMSAADTAAMVATVRRIGFAADDSLVLAGQRRLTQTQRSDGSWPSEDAAVFDVHTTLAGIRACRST